MLTEAQYRDYLETLGSKKAKQAEIQQAMQQCIELARQQNDRRRVLQGELTLLTVEINQIHKAIAEYDAAQKEAAAKAAEEARAQVAAEKAERLEQQKQEAAQRAAQQRDELIAAVAEKTGADPAAIAAELIKLQLHPKP